MNELKDRLKQARKSAGLTQSELAERAGIKQSSVSEIERGLSRSSAHLIKLAQVCNVDPIWLADGSAEDREKMERVRAALHRQFHGPSEDEYALIPTLLPKESGDPKLLDTHVEVREGLVFRKDWLQKMKSKPENLHVIYADDNSMEPYILQGDAVLFDASQTDPWDKNVYVIQRPRGGFSIRRLNQNLRGIWVISGDSRDKISHPDELSTVETVHELPIVGRVIWRGGGVE